MDQRKAFVVVIEYEGKPLDRKTTVTVERALSDTAHRVMQSRLLERHGETSINIEVKPMATNDHE